MSELLTEETRADDAGTVEVRRNAGLAGAIGGVASVVAIMYLSRAAGSGAWLDWGLCAVMGLVAAAYLQAFVDARTPLLVADEHGVRLRTGRDWHGLPWDAVEAVELRPRRGLFSDGWLEVFPVDGGAVSVPLSLSTRVAGADGDLSGALSELAGAQVEVVELVDDAPDAVEPAASDEPVAPGHLDEPVEADLATDLVVSAEPVAEPAPGLASADHSGYDPDYDSDADEAPRGPVLPDPRPTLARGIGALAARLRRAPGAEGAGGGTPQEGQQHAPLVASATPSPLRDPMSAARVEVRSDLTMGANALRLDPSETEDGTGRHLPEARELRRPGSVSLYEDTVVWDETVTPIARAGEPVEPLVIEAFPVEPAADPVIGPELVAARTRLGLTVDQLADRTRIRPHVIESVEVDDFAPCGGDFYARGHLRTLARVLGIDATPLLASYDERYADAPISPRRVFEAELATGAHAGIRGTRGGPNWSVLVAAVMVLVLAWSIARLVMDSPATLNEAPPLNGSGGLAAPGAPVPVLLDAAGGGAAVKVVDGSGKTVFDGDLAFGQTRLLKRVPTPVRVTSSDGSLKVTLGDAEPMKVGDTGVRSTRSFGSR